MTPKNVQISWELYLELLKYFELGTGDPDRIREELNDKLRRMVDRQLYSKFHDPNVTPEEREKARQDYLDSRGIPADFRW